MNESAAAILEVVRTLPVHTLTTDLRSPRGVATRTFRGALLSDYADATGLTPRREGPVGPGNHYVVATAEDGFIATIAWFEVAPRASTKQVLLAFEQDGESVRAGVRLVVPGDDLGGRSIFGLASLEVRSVPSSTTSDPLPPVAHVTIEGMLERPGTLSVDDLTRFATHEVETAPTIGHGGRAVPAHRWTGALLWDVLEDAGLILDDAINEDILRRIVIVRGADGRAAAIAPGEIEPRFMAGQALLATHCDGAPLPPEDGAIRLIVPHDRAEGRLIRQVQSIEVRQG